MNTNYEKEFVLYEQALALKELGFDEPFKIFDQAIVFRNKGICMANEYALEYFDFYGDEVISAPLKQQVFRWFRDKYGLKISFPYWNGFNKMIPEDLGRDKYEIMIIPANHRTISVRNPKGRIWFDTYEEAELAYLIKLIELVKNK